MRSELNSNLKILKSKATTTQLESVFLPVLERRKQSLMNIPLTLKSFSLLKEHPEEQHFAVKLNQILLN